VEYTDIVTDSAGTGNGRPHGYSNAIALLAAHWPEGARQHAACALAGGLLRAHWDVEATERFVEQVALTARDEEAQKRVGVVRPTAAKLEAGGEVVTGWPALTRLLGEGGEEVVRRVRAALGLTITLAGLARHKALPVDYLAGLGLHDLPEGGVGIPFRDGAGRTVAVKTRTALEAGKGSYWPKGQRLMIYGEDRLEDAAQADYRILVEGESDCWTLWFHHFPALGLPGANTVGKTLTLGHIGSRRRLFVIQEPGQGGEAFVANVAERVRSLGWDGEVFSVRLDGSKDPSELHTKNQEGFKAAFQAALDCAAALPPSATAGATATSVPPWPDPVSLNEVPPVPPFPLDVLPAPLQRVVKEVAQALPCPEDYVGVPLLVMAGAALGASRALAVKRGHVQQAILFAAVVGPPGSAKTPALNFVAEPVHEAEELVHAAWKEQMERYEADLDAYEAELKAWKKSRDGDRPQKPARPSLQRRTVNDATAEALVPILQENPRGVALVRDELVGWVQAMNQYREGGRGADQQFWMSAWSGITVKVDRKKTHELGPLCVRHPFIGVIGGLTPDKLPTLRGDKFRQRAEQDGFIDRVLMAYPQEPRATAENWLEVADDTRTALRSVMERLLTLEMVPSTDAAGAVLGHRPFVVKLSATGRHEWQRFTEAHAHEINGGHLPSHLIGPWSKLKGYAARLALVIHYLRWACDEAQDGDVDGESMARAVRLIDYFKAHARKVYAVMDADPRVADARRVLHWIERQRKARFQKRDAYQALKGTFKTLDELEPVLTLLEKQGYVRPELAQERHGPGRKPSPFYEVHATILSGSSHNSHNPQNTPDLRDSGDCGNCGNAGSAVDSSSEGWEEGEVM
jgi:hypothetical protein